MNVDSMVWHAILISNFLSKVFLSSLELTAVSAHVFDRRLEGQEDAFGLFAGELFDSGNSVAKFLQGPQ